MVAGNLAADMLAALCIDAVEKYDNPIFALVANILAT